MRQLPSPTDCAARRGGREEMQRVDRGDQALRAWRDSIGVRAGAVVPRHAAGDGYEGRRSWVAALARFELNSHGAGEPVAPIVIPGGRPCRYGLRRRRSRRRGAPPDRAAGGDAREIARASGKLANEGFVANAPEPVVARERAKLERLREELAALPAPSEGG